MVRHLLFILAIVGLFLKVNSQDIHFSQFYYSPYQLNPANTGHFDGDWRIANIYRTQWGAVSKPFNTIGIGIDKQIRYYSQHFGAGIYFLNDQSGGANLTANKIMLALAYHTRWQAYKIHGGIQLGFVHKKYGSNISFPSQFDWGTGQFNAELPNNESNLQDHLSYLDVNVGLIVSRKMGAFEPEFGYSVSHINNPTEQFSNVKSRLPLRHTWHAEVRTELSEKFFAIPRILIMNHKRAGDMVLGVNLGYYLPKNNFYAQSLFFGPHLRTVLSTTDALIFALGLNFKNMDIGVSYDINVSSLSKASSHRGALEFTLIYRTRSSHPKTIAIPCNRY